MTLRRLSIGPYIPNVARVVPEDVRLLKVSKKNPNPAKDGLMPPSKKHKGSYGEPKYMSKYLKDSKTAVSWLKVPAEPITVPAKMEDHVAFSLSVDTLDTRREGMKDEADFFRSFPKGMFEVTPHLEDPRVLDVSVHCELPVDAKCAEAHVTFQLYDLEHPSGEGVVASELPLAAFER